MSERLVLDENIIYKAILKNEDKHEECKKLVVIIYEVKHALVCSRNLWKRYGKIIKNINRKNADNNVLIFIEMKLRTSGEKGGMRIENIDKKRIKNTYQELFKRMERDFKACFKHKAKHNEEDLEIAKLASVCMVYALITEDSELYGWMGGFLTRSSDLYENLRLRKPKILNSSEALKDKKINLELSYSKHCIKFLKA